jgi:flavin-binding protein dodecin
MSVAKITEIQASSPKSFEDALKTGIARADKTLRNITGAWVKSQKVVIEKGKVTEYRVLLKVTFVLQDK